MSIRMQRVQHQLLHEIYQIIAKDVKDPRVEGNFITVTEVNAAPDLSQAKIYVTIMGDDPYKVLEGLNRSSGYIRSILGKRLHLKKIPKMDFYLDESFARADKINRIIEDIDNGENE
jgi:ribosome-binding factor A